MSTPVQTRDWTSADAGAEIVHYRADSGIAIVEMDDPPANTYTYAMMRQLDDAMLKARFDDDVHVIVLRGKGDRFFSAGARKRTSSVRTRCSAAARCGWSCSISR